MKSVLVSFFLALFIITLAFRAEAKDSDLSSRALFLLMTPKQFIHIVIGFLFLWFCLSVSIYFFYNEGVY